MLTWAVFNRKCWLWLVIESNLVRLSGFISLALLRVENAVSLRNIESASFAS